MTIKAKSEELHDRATRGEVLTVEEQAQLQAWYDKEDQAEFQKLKAAISADAALDDQINATFEQLTAAIAQIQKLALENDTLCRENLNLRRKLSEQPLLRLV